MIQNTESIHQAIEDISMIRRVLESAQKGTFHSQYLQGITFKVNFIIQLVALIGCAGLFLIEVFSSLSVTQILLATQYERELQIYSVGCMAYALAVLLGTLYFILWRASKYSSLNLESFILKNFSYLKNLSLFMDLLVKLCVTTLLLLAQKPEWIAPIFLLFTADYLIQGRFFTLPLKVGFGLGVVCLIAAFIQYSLHSATFIWPILAFGSTTLLSLMLLMINQRKYSNENK